MVKLDGSRLEEPTDRPRDAGRKVRSLPEHRALRAFKAELFKALAHPTRIHIIELLRASEKTVGELQVSLGIEPSSVSQQLGVLRAKQVVAGRKEGTSVYYRVVDPNVFTLLDTSRQIFNNRLIDLQSIAEDEGVEEPAAGELEQRPGGR